MLVLVYHHHLAALAVVTEPVWRRALAVFCVTCFAAALLSLPVPQKGYQNVCTPWEKRKFAIFNYKSTFNTITGEVRWNF